MTKTYEDALVERLKELEALLICKHRDYGTQNLLKFGELGILVRATDKIERLTNLHKNGEAALKSETGRDTWVDLAGYAIQALMMQDGDFDLPMGEDALDTVGDFMKHAPSP